MNLWIPFLKANKAEAILVLQAFYRFAGNMFASPCQLNQGEAVRTCPSCWNTWYILHSLGTASLQNFVASLLALAVLISTFWIGFGIFPGLKALPTKVISTYLRATCLATYSVSCLGILIFHDKRFANRALFPTYLLVEQVQFKSKFKFLAFFLS